MTHDYSPLDPPPDSVTPAVRRRINPPPLLVRLLTEHNPFYLLSAACMLASCLALTNSLSWIPIARTRLLTLVLTLNAYEAALLGIALFLVKRRGLVRDGRMLLLLQAFFVADFSFLNAELATADLRTGLLVNGALLGLAALKLAAVVYVLRPAFTPLQFTFVVLELAVLFAMPCVLRWHNVTHPVVGPRELYVAWWSVALLPAAYELFAWLDGRRRAAAAPLAATSSGAHAAPVGAYLALPYLSLLTHLGILHYVYDTPFYGAHAAPTLLGLTLILNRAAPTALIPRKDRLALRVLLPLAAVLVSANNPWGFGPAAAYPRVSVSTLGLALAGAYLVYVYCFLRRHALTFLGTGAAAALAYALGPSRRQIGDALTGAWEWTSTLASRLAPRTLADWGVIGLVASFAFLALGFWVSLTKRPLPLDEAEVGLTDAPPPPPLART
jgi:hypothetical protein